MEKEFTRKRVRAREEPDWSRTNETDNLTPSVRTGAADGAQTRNLLLGKQAFYQLNYSRTMVGVAGFEPATSCPPDKRANQTAPYPEEDVYALVTKGLSQVPSLGDFCGLSTSPTPDGEGRET